MTLSSGTRLGPYEIQNLLGSGGMGEVYRAYDARLGRQVAVKLLTAADATDPDAIQRFIREARAASALNHPNIVTIHEIGEAEAGRFIVMELVEGRTLRALVGERRPVEWLVDVGQQIARALAIAHAAGIVHRDIKPENLIMREDGYVKVLDFGLARLLPAGGAPSGVATATATRAGTLLGTLRYMSPEQARGEPVTTATDMFSFGLVLYELATGRHPFAANSQLAMLEGILAQSPLPPGHLNPEIPDSLEALILHLLEKDARLRPTAGDVETRLAELAGKRDAPLAPPAVLPAARHTVGRTGERAEMLAAFDAVAHGTGTILCVSGEPGIGKTTIVEDVLAELSVTRRAPHIARGRCSERLAGAEAYLPWLEALESLLQTSRPGSGSTMFAAGDSVARLMKAVAPTWYVQVAPLAADDSSDERLRSDVKATSQERMKRELTAFCQEVSRVRPLVILFDDIHWADASTVDLIAYLATRLASMPVLMVLTYRPSELALSQHPFGPLKLELQARGICREIGLDFLSRDDVDRYVTLEFPEHRFPADFATLVHARTEGSPLFMVDLLRDLRAREVTIQEQGRWTLARAVPDLARELPASVRSMIQRKIDRLADNDRRLLVAASVQGAEFDAAVVARALALDAGDVEERLETLDRIHAFVRRVGEQEFPDRTVTLRYRFVHMLYQNALYGSLTPARKASLSAAVAHALMTFYGEQSSAIAAQLAFLFEAARDFSRASDHFSTAAWHAASVFANQEAVLLARRGLAALNTLPDTADRRARELSLLLALGFPLASTAGYASLEVEQTYLRARDLSRELSDRSQLFWVLDGLAMIYGIRGELRASLLQGEELMRLALGAGDPPLTAEAYWGAGFNLAGLGDFSGARQRFEAGIRAYDPRREPFKGPTPIDPGVCCRCGQPYVLWPLGFADQALMCVNEVVAMSRELRHPEGTAFALFFAALVHQFRREPEQTLESAAAAVEISAEHGLATTLAWGDLMRGWGLAGGGAVEEGTALMHESLRVQRAMGCEAMRPYFLGLLADALGRAGRVKVALDALAEAFSCVERTEERYYEAELYRLEGELMLMQMAKQTVEFDSSRAETCYRQAIDTARRQQAKSFELRATTSLSRLYMRQGRRPEAREILASIYRSFTEGFDTADLRDAKTLLEELSSD